MLRVEYAVPAAMTRKSHDLDPMGASDSHPQRRQLLFRNRVDLREHIKHRLLRRAKLCENLIDDVALLFPVVMAGVDNVQQ